jgi:flagellar hook-associated protein 1 FlgK
MSLSHSLSAAFSGLTASSAAASIVAENMANLRTPGYGRREVLLGTSAIGGGVMIRGVMRQTDMLLLGERRNAQALSTGAETRMAFHRSIETTLGLPGEDGALDSLIGRFDAALITAAASPSSDPALAGVLDAAQALAGKLRTVTGQIQQARQTADQAIASDVATLNSSLVQIEALNSDIQRMTVLGQDASALVDQRQALVDGIARILPVREVARGNGRIALYASGGLALVDEKAAQFGFTASGMIGAGSGGLSGLTMNGRPVRTGADGPLHGGSLAANFALRDTLAPAAQARLDAVARDLADRMRGADPTIAPGSAGLFTDGGGAFDPLAETGFAGRIAVNPLADPAQGGALWRLRAGLGAAVPGDPGDGGLLTGLSAALNQPSATASGGFQPVLRSFQALGAELVSGIATARLAGQSEATQSAARLSALEELEAQGGVDTDHETQLLLVIERAYAANARVIETVERMLDSLLEI